MNRILLVCSILVAVTGTAAAQVSNADFTSKITGFGNYVTQGNLGGQINSLEELNGLMNNQMTWLKAAISSHQSKETTDEAKATADMNAAQAEKTKAQADLAAAEKELNQGNGTKANADIDKAQKAVTTARDDEHKAHDEKEAARHQKADIDVENKNLAIEQKAYNDIQPLKADIKNEPKEKKDALVSYLKSFAETLK